MKKYYKVKRINRENSKTIYKVFSVNNIFGILFNKWIEYKKDNENIDSAIKQIKTIRGIQYLIPNIFNKLRWWIHANTFNYKVNKTSSLWRKIVSDKTFPAFDYFYNSSGIIITYNIQKEKNIIERFEAMSDRHYTTGRIKGTHNTLERGLIQVLEGLRLNK